MLQFAELTWPERLRSLWQFLRLELKLVFFRRYLLLLCAALAYVFTLLRVTRVLGYTLSPADVWLFGLQLPAILAAIYFSMELVTAERGTRTIEMLFALPGSRYRFWLARFFMLLAALALLVCLADIWVAVLLPDFVPGMAFVHVMASVYLVSALTLALSVLLKSGNGAGLISALIVIGFLVRVGSATTWLDLFLNPFGRPAETDYSIWTNILNAHLVLYFLLGSILLWLAVRWAERRERLL